MADYIIINDDLRTMQIPSSIVLLGVESDDDVNRIQFQMPKEYSGFDLSTFSARINYMNAHGDGDIYVVDDLEVDGDNMTFTWLVGRNACMYKGQTRFIVCLKLFDGDEVVKEFNTTVYSLPVLEGLETTEAVVQQNADIIQYLINLMEQSGTIDPSNYYTKQEVDDLIPTKLPNPESLTINGQEYDGSEPVDITIEASSEVLTTRSGKVIHINDAVADEAVENLLLYDDNDDELSEGTIAVANKNLFRIDLLASQVVSKGITFTKNADGSITCNGTSTGTYPMTSCSLDKNMFDIGKTYTVSSGKTSGFTYVQLIMNYADGTTDYIVARNSARAFTIAKEVSSCTASVQLTDSGVTISNETVYPQLEIGASATAFVNNTFSEISFNGTVMPVLPAAICNVWANDDVVANMVMEYEADVVLGKVDDYANENLITIPADDETIAARHDGARTVELFKISAKDDSQVVTEADRAVADQNGNVIDLTYATKDELNEIADIDEIATALSFEISETEKQIQYADGNVGTYQNGMITDFIQISGYTKISYRRIETTAVNPTNGMAFYDANHNYISGIQSLANQSAVKYVDELFEVNIPMGAEYARFTCLKDTSTYGSFAINGIKERNIVKTVHDIQTGIVQLDRKVDDLSLTKLKIVNQWRPHSISGQGVNTATDSHKHVSSYFLLIDGDISVSVADTYKVALRIYKDDFDFSESISSAQQVTFSPSANQKYARIIIISPVADTVDNIVSNSEISVEGLLSEYSLSIDTNASHILTSGACTEEEALLNVKKMTLLEEIISEGGGGTIRFEQGEYWFSTNSYIEMRPNVSIIGAGIGATVLKKKSIGSQGNYPLFDCKLGESDPDYPICHFEHSNFTIDCSEWEYGAGSTTLKAYQGYFCKNAMFHDIEIVGSPATAFGIDYCHQVIITSCIFKDCGRYWGTYNTGGSNGIGLMTGQWEEEVVIITDNIFDGCGRHAVFFERKTGVADGKGQIISNNVIKNGRWCGIGIYIGNTITITANHIYNCRGAGILVKNDVDNITINGNTIADCGTATADLNNYDYTIASADMGGIRKEGNTSDGVILTNNILRANVGGNIIIDQTQSNIINTNNVDIAN